MSRGSSPSACRSRIPRSLAAGSRGPRRSRLQGELSRREDADADRLPPSFGQDDVLFDAILRNRKINIAKVHGDLNGFLERTGLGGLEELLDRLDRMLVRQGRSPPAVRAARMASCRGEAAKERGPNKALRTRDAGSVFGELRTGLDASPSSVARNRRSERHRRGIISRPMITA